MARLCASLLSYLLTHAHTRLPQVGGDLLELGSHYVCDFNGTHVSASLAPSSLTEYVDFTRQESDVYLPSESVRL